MPPRTETGQKQACRKSSNASSEWMGTVFRVMLSLLWPIPRAIKGTIFEHLAAPDHPAPSREQRLAWCRELTEAVEHIPSKRVVHCDIQPTNILVDQNLNISS
ncbi:hypothetical protein BKA67DRAFT_674661 [Truncatella angustata]|uniref:Protein kinase domain-containing protein n=1 Tax=Truncatella angustata TaxID=152316 RepID=A0A9P9A1Z0_9PEZI|nr:uncharacterized protein BKA67DRAFT_674661 [Truncatella angustata]KAH6658594.1 hypothetical protein BKA67DRAFT_674661 [Truncatella angustata]